MVYPIFLSLGSNLGDRAAYLAKARNALDQLVGTICLASACYETKPWGLSEQPLFYNQVLKMETNVNPRDLLNQILQIEHSIGRVRKRVWGERIIDIDILYYENQIIDLPDLTIPHPQIPARRFVLVPLVEIAPNYQHPRLNVSQKQLLEDCEDSLEVIKIE